jgi:hypothetical protein
MKNHLVKPDSFSKRLKRKQLVLFIMVAALCIFDHIRVYSQVSATTYQNFSFGAFSPGNSGGTVTVAANGSRTVTGDVIAVNLGFQYFPAIFEIEAPVGTIINIVNGPDTQLTGSNGGAMTLRVEGHNPAPPFISSVSPPQKTPVTVGATLTVSTTASNPAGNYSGSFSLTFVQE